MKIKPDTTKKITGVVVAVVVVVFFYQLYTVVGIVLTYVVAMRIWLVQELGYNLP